MTASAIRAEFGECHIVPCGTICNMGLGAYHEVDDNDRRREIVDWFLPDDRYPDDRAILDMATIGWTNVSGVCEAVRSSSWPSVGRVVCGEVLLGFIHGDFKTPEDFPNWLKVVQSELAECLRGLSKQASFLARADLESYDLLPHARSSPPRARLVSDVNRGSRSGGAGRQFLVSPGVV